MAQLKIDIPTKEQIEKRAYELYLARGCEPGMDVEDWLAAERELTAQTNVAQAAVRRTRQTKGRRLTPSRAVLA